MLPSNVSRPVRQRVCIITPWAIGSNPRVVKEADALHEAGWQVTVIATRTMACVEARDAALKARVKWSLIQIDLRNPTKWRLYRLFQIAMRKSFEMTRIRCLANFAFSAFTLPLINAARKVAADIYIAHYPAALPAAALAAKWNGAKFAYDAEDFHLGDWIDAPQYDYDRLLVRSIEGQYLPNCSSITAAAPGIADAYVEAYAIPRPRVILNVFPLSQSPSQLLGMGTARPGPSVYWFSQTIGPDRGLESAVIAIGLAKTRPHLYLRGTLALGFQDELKRLANLHGARERIHILSPGLPDEMEGLASVYDLGLCGETSHTANNARALSNKLFTFLLAGVPPIMSNTPAQCAFAAETGLNDQIYPINDARALAGLFDRFLGDPTQLARARARAWKLARERYCWEVERSSLTEAIIQAQSRVETL